MRVWVDMGFMTQYGEKGSLASCQLGPCGIAAHSGQMARFFQEKVESICFYGHLHFKMKADSFLNPCGANEMCETHLVQGGANLPLNLMRIKKQCWAQSLPPLPV